MTEEQLPSPGKDVQEVTRAPLSKDHFLKIASEGRDPNNRGMLLTSLPKKIRDRLDSTHPTYQRNYDIWQAQLDAFLGEGHPALQGKGRENLAREIYQTLRSFGLDLTDRNLPRDKLVKEFLNSRNLQPFKEIPFEVPMKLPSREQPFLEEPPLEPPIKAGEEQPPQEPSQVKIEDEIKDALGSMGISVNLGSAYEELDKKRRDLEDNLTEMNLLLPGVTEKDRELATQIAQQAANRLVLKLIGLARKNNPDASPEVLLRELTEMTEKSLEPIRDDLERLHKPRTEEEKISPSTSAVEAGTVQPVKEEPAAVKEAEETPVKPGDPVKIVFGEENITYTPSDQDAEHYWQRLRPEDRDYYKKLARTSIEMSAKQGILGVPVQDTSGFQEADKELMAAFCQQARELGYEIVGDFEINYWTKRVEAPIRKIGPETQDRAASGIPAPETPLTPERQAPEETKQLVNGPSEDDTEYATIYWQYQGNRAGRAEEEILKRLSDIADREGTIDIHNGPGTIWPTTREYFAVYRQVAKKVDMNLGIFKGQTVNILFSALLSEEYRLSHHKRGSTDNLII